MYALECTDIEEKEKAIAIFKLNNIDNEGDKNKFINRKYDDIANNNSNIISYPNTNSNIFDIGKIVYNENTKIGIYN